MQPSDFSLVIAAARKEAERQVKASDRAAIMSFAPVFEIRGRNLWMMHGGVTADLGLVVAEKGDLGPRGVDGNNGCDGLDGKAGIDGQDGRNGIDGRDGIDGKDGADGKDGVGVSKAYVSDAGYLILEFTDGRKVTAGYVKGKDGKDGAGGQILFGGGSGSQGGGSGGASAWGEITGTLSTQTDLQSALNAKASTSSLAGYQPLASVLTNTTASYTTTEAAKLSGIASGATANSSDATLLARGNHTGTQLAATISDFNTAADARVTAGITGKQDTLSSGTNIKTINGSSVLGSGNLTIATPTAPQVDVFNYTGAWQPYTIPANARILLIKNIGAGGNGGAGFSRTAGSAGGGGGGGGAGGVTYTQVSVADLGVSTLQVFPCQSNNGAVGTVSIAANTTAQNVLSRSVVGTAGGNGTGAAAGTAGAAGAVTTNATTILASLGVFNFLPGQIGGAGGAQTGAVGGSVTWGNTGITNCSGAGGAGCTTTDFAGGAITGNGAVVASVAAGTAGGGAGNPGVEYSGRGMWTGGSGGGSNNSGTGGRGGDGAIGCGGGGGGAGVTGGAGGVGGHGRIYITAIF